MSEPLYAGQKESVLYVAASWSRRHQAMSTFMFILLVAGAFFSIKPVEYQMSHFMAENCGALVSQETSDYIDTQNEDVGKQDVHCFVQAHQQCTAATLSITYVATMSSSDWSFRTANSVGDCKLSVMAYEKECGLSFVCALTPFLDADCQAMEEWGDGLHFLDCGGRKEALFHI